MKVLLNDSRLDREEGWPNIFFILNAAVGKQCLRRHDWKGFNALRECGVTVSLEGDHIL